MNLKRIFKTFSLSAITVFLTLTFSARAWGQLNIASGTRVNESFNSIGTSATANLPTGFRADKLTTVRTVGTYTAAAIMTEQRAGSGSGGNTNGIYNFGAGDPATGAVCVGATGSRHDLQCLH